MASSLALSHVQDAVGVSEWNDDLVMQALMLEPPTVASASSSEGASASDAAASGHGAKVVDVLVHGCVGVDEGALPVRLDPRMDRVTPEAKARITAFVKRWRQHFLDRWGVAVSACVVL